MNGLRVVFENEQKLREHFPSCKLIFKAPREKVLADGVLQGIQESTMAEIISYYSVEEHCDIYAICGNQTSTWDAIKLLQEVHGRNGRAFLVSNYFKENIKNKRPMSTSFSTSNSLNNNPVLVIGSVNVPDALTANAITQRNSVQDNIVTMIDEMSNLKVNHHCSKQSCSSTVRSQLDTRLNKCQMYRQSNPVYSRHSVDSSNFCQFLSGNGDPILENLPIPHITVHGNNEAIQLIKPKRICYNIIDILSRYRTKTSRMCPKEWDYLITINPEVFTSQFMQQRINRYLDYWNIEEY